MESSLTNIFHISTFWNFENCSNLDPSSPNIFWYLFQESLQKKRLVSLSVFEGPCPEYALEHLQRPIISTKCKIISKSEWIKHIFQRVTYHLSENLSPRGLLVFIENHFSEIFSPRTFLVFIEKPRFYLQRFPLNSRK